MKTSTRDLLQHFDGYVGDKWDKLRDVGNSISGTVKHQAEGLGVRAGEQWEEGKRAIVSAEEYLAESIRKNPGLFIGIGIGIAATVAAAIILSRTRR